MHSDETVKSSKYFSIAQQIARSLLRTGVILLVLAWVGGMFGRLDVRLELLSHFQVQYLIAGVGFSGALWVARDRWWSIAPLIVGALSAAAVLPWYWPRAMPRCDGTCTTLRVMQFNVKDGNEAHDAVIAEVRRTHPDVIVFQEISQRWESSLQQLDDILPHSYFQPAAMLRGNLVRSRIPITDAMIEPSIDSMNAPSMSLTLQLPDATISVLVAHTTPPHDAYFAGIRNQELMRLAKRAQELPRPLIMLGDLNATMWSPHYRDFERASGLINARCGFGTIATFPMDEYRLLRVPLDHCLVSDDLAARNCRRGLASGSDHAPLVVDLAVTRLGREADTRYQNAD